MKVISLYIIIHFTFFNIVIGQSESQSVQFDSIKTLYLQKDYKQVLLQSSELILSIDENELQGQLNMIKPLSLMGKSYYYLGLYDNSIEIFNLFLNDPLYILPNDFERINREYLAKAIQAIESDTNIVQQESVTKSLIEENKELKERLKTDSSKDTPLSKIDNNYDHFGTILFFVLLIAILGLTLYLYLNRKGDSNNDMQLLQFIEGSQKRIQIEGIEIPVSQIQYVKTSEVKNYVDVLFTKNDQLEKKSTKLSLTNIYERLPQAHFARLNGSFIINLSIVVIKEQFGRDSFILFGDRKEKLTETYKAEFQHKRENYDKLRTYNSVEKSPNTT